MTTPPRTLTVLIDSREKKPLCFPAVLRHYPNRGSSRAKLIPIRSFRVKLPAGDYALKGHRSCCLLERKGSIEEVASNLLTNDYARFRAALERLAASCTYPYLLIDESLARMNRSSWVEQPDRVLQFLISETTSLGIRLLWIGGSKRPRAKTVLGATILRIMLVHALSDREPKLPASSVVGQDIPDTI